MTPYRFSIDLYANDISEKREQRILLARKKIIYIF
jgi:hypothetical protein